MGCYVTCSVSASRKGMRHVLEAMGAEDAEGMIRDAEESGGSVPSAYAFMTAPHVRVHGDTYVVTMAMSRTSRGALTEIQGVAERLPDGEYGIAYAFAWDYEPDLVALNSDYQPYHGGGTSVPECLRDPGNRHMDASVARAKVARIGWREGDMPEADLQQVADAEALRCWVDLYYGEAV